MICGYHYFWKHPYVRSSLIYLSNVLILCYSLDSPRFFSACDFLPRDGTKTSHFGGEADIMAIHGPWPITFGASNTSPGDEEFIRFFFRFLWDQGSLIITRFKM